MSSSTGEERLDLRPYWHPVAWAVEVGTAPFATMLLGERLVLWRVGGRVLAAPDRCPHRGTALSLGTIEGQHLVCAYHGLHFDAAGRCRKVPQVGPDTPISAQSNLETFSCEERYGLIWVALAPPRFDIPAFPEWGDSQYHHARCEAYTWATSAGRMVENFADFAHLGYLHAGLLGDREDLLARPYRVRQLGHELHYEVLLSMPGANKHVAHADLEAAGGTQRNAYTLSLPFSVRLRCQYRDGTRCRTVFFAVQPRADTEATGYCYQSRNFDLEADDEAFTAFQAVLVSQDRPIVESQLPPELPLDATAELQLPFDRVAIAYRRALRELMLQRPQGGERGGLTRGTSSVSV